MQVSLVT